MVTQPVRLDDKYALDRGRVFMTGVQALVRLPMLQKRRDEAAGLNTACFISGYRGSPLGGFDRALWQAEEFVRRHAIHFRPGVNEDLAATAIWGSQQAPLDPGATVEGVFALWYGKGPGVDRSGDAFRHANMAGTARYGGVLALAGDDHVCASSTLPHQSEFAFVDAMIPVLAPSGIEELLDYGLLGFALSRFAGLWVALICVADVVESSGTVALDPGRVAPVAPAGFALPPGGLNIRWPDTSLEQEQRLHEHKIPAAQAFARANGLDRIALNSPDARFGVAAVGKAYADLREALGLLGLDEAGARALGLRLYKIGMSWPLEPEGAREFARGLEEILVVEEKRALVEPQLKEALYGSGAPRILGKTDEDGRPLLPAAGELTPARIARALAGRLAKRPGAERFRDRLAYLDALEARRARPAAPSRRPYFCSGCPHNSSTKIPEGSRAFAGIGCHYMVQWMDRETQMFTQMGAEGANWIGLAPFTATPHVFQNIGDGTYYHSGLLAIRAAIAAKVNITYKILYNDAVAMTGGQPVDGPLDVAMIARQLDSEGVERIALVSDRPEKYPPGARFPKGLTIHPRGALDAVQRELREWPGVSVLIYDQMCATEKRRRRKRGLIEDPARFVFINERVCEGCGDCSRASNCLSVVPVETEYGRKRAIDYASCNKDESCVEGFCPSFVIVEGARLRRAGKDGLAPLAKPLPEPARPGAEAPWNALIAGIGGTGVVTLGQILATAAHIEGCSAAALDHTGLAQKYGAVFSHVRIADRPGAIFAPRIPDGTADLLIGCDLIVAGSAEALSKASPSRTAAVVNGRAAITGEFTRDPDLVLPEEAVRAALAEAARGAPALVDAARYAEALAGDAIGANLLLLGFAYQKGLVPVGADAIEQAIRLNGVAVATNLAAFRWGRRAAADPEGTEEEAARAGGTAARPRLSTTLDALIENRAADLADYQNENLARRYRALMAKARAAERRAAPGREELSLALARNYYRLLAYKDEYEVARLYSRPEFRAALARRFEGRYRLSLSLAPPLLAAHEPLSGHAKKRSYGPWIFPLLRALARLRALRGTPFDPFGWTAERRRERKLIAEYEATIAEALRALSPQNYADALELAQLPEQIRGFGHVKEAAIVCAKEREAQLVARLRAPLAHASAA